MGWRKMIKGSSKNIFLISILIILLGCSKTKPPLQIFPDMDDQKKVKPMAEYPLFKDGQSIQEPVPGTIARGELYSSALRNPLSATEKNLKRGEFVFQNFCMPCHGTDAKGFGPVVQRGFIPPPSLVTGRVKDWNDPQIFKTITEGQNTMPSYAHLVDREDRWAIILYLRKLQK